MARPTKQEQIAIKKRNTAILKDLVKGYPRDYICEYYNISKGSLSKLIKDNLLTRESVIETN